MADYIDRQAAIAAIDKYAEYLYGLPRELIASEVKNIISMLPGPWVSVEVQPTPGGKDVLLAIGQTDVFMGYRVGGQYYDSECCGTYGVTHWMDKPDAPEVGK